MAAYRNELCKHCAGIISAVVRSKFVYRPCTLTGSGLHLARHRTENRRLPISIENIERRRRAATATNKYNSLVCENSPFASSPTLQNQSLSVCFGKQLPVAVVHCYLNRATVAMFNDMSKRLLNELILAGDSLCTNFVRAVNARGRDAAMLLSTARNKKN